MTSRNLEVAIIPVRDAYVNFPAPGALTLTVAAFTHGHGLTPVANRCSGRPSP
ncbi:uncharacterized protein LOC100124857 [Anopheles sinensis]|uniref:Uncharacterized protein LOC100124857 n=1 Tax=Anopheles sinensis TaxID=74873 RepID=A0A084VDA7_ANOSI|nr:uncharacterized protein LOC100124857 [Anopheles sinensis]